MTSDRERGARRIPLMWRGLGLEPGAAGVDAFTTPLRMFVGLLNMSLLRRLGAIVFEGEEVTFPAGIRRSSSGHGRRL